MPSISGLFTSSKYVIDAHVHHPWIGVLHLMLDIKYIFSFYISKMKQNKFWFLFSHSSFQSILNTGILNKSFTVSCFKQLSFWNMQFLMIVQWMLFIRHNLTFFRLVMFLHFDKFSARGQPGCSINSVGLFWANSLSYGLWILSHMCFMPSGPINKKMKCESSSFSLLRYSWFYPRK